MADLQLAIITNTLVPNRDVRRATVPLRPGTTLGKALQMIDLDPDAFEVWESGGVLPYHPDQITPLPEHVYTIRPRMQGGGGNQGGGKSAERWIGQIVVAIVAIVSSVLSYGALAKPWGAYYAGVFAAAVGSAVMTAGSLAVNAFFPIQQPDTPQLDFGGDWASSPTYSWRISNNDKPGFPVPVIYGAHRTGGTLISESIFNDGDKQYLKQVYALADHEVESITDIRINGQSVDKYPGVTVETRLGTLSQTPISFVKTIARDRAVSRLVEYSTPVEQTTTHSDVEGLRVTLQWPRGMYVRNLDGTLDTLSCQVKIEYRVTGAPSWTSWVDETITTKNTSPFFRTWEKTGLTADQYDIKVTRVSADDATSRAQSIFYWATYTELIPEDLSYPGVALLGISALATDQLSGGRPRVDCLVTRGDITVYEQDGTAHTVSSDNPAWACWDLLNNSRYGGGISYANLDYNRFLTWANWNDELVPDGDGGTEKRNLIDIVFDAQMTLFEAADKCCSVGRAKLSQVGATYSVLVDKATSATNLYSAGSIIKDSLKIYYLPLTERANEVEVQYINADNDYARDNLTVIDQDSDYTNKITINLTGVTRQSQAQRHGRYLLYNNKYLLRTAQFKVGFDGLIDELGDVILIQHDVPQWGYGGRVVSATTTTLTLDRDVTMVEGTSYAVSVRQADGTLVEEKQVATEPGTTSTITVSTPWATIPSADMVYAFGETSQVTEAFRIIAINRAGDDMAEFEITGLEYNASVYACDTDTPTLEPSATALDPPQVSGLTLSEDLVRQGDRYQPRLLVAWIPPTYYGGARVFISLNGSAEEVYEVGVGETSFALEVTDGTSAVVTVVAYDDMGVISPKEDAPTLGYTVQGKTAPPEDVTNLRAAPSLTGLTLSWDAVSDIDIKEYVIRHSNATSGATWETANEITRTTGTTKTLHAAQNGTYFVKALDTSDIYSTNAASIVTTLPETIRWNATETQSDSTGAWDEGTMTDLTERADGDLQMVGGGDLWAVSDMWALPNVWMYGGVVSPAYYTFSEIDLGSIQDCRVTTDIRFYGLDWTDSLWNVADMWSLDDVWDSISDVGCQMQIRTKDAPADSYSDWRDIWCEDVTARYFQLRMKAWSDHDEHTPVISKVEVVIDMPDREEYGSESVALTGSTITFSKTFLITGGPRVGVQVVDGAAGDYCDVSNVTTASFDAQVRDSAGNAKTGTVLWRAVGY